jgi:hypothetical protein
MDLKTAALTAALCMLCYLGGVISTMALIAR